MTGSGREWKNYEGGHNCEPVGGQAWCEWPPGSGNQPPLACPLISHLFDLAFKLPPLLLPFNLFLSRELSGPSQSSRNPEALSTSAQHSLPFLQPPTANTTSCTDQGGTGVLQKWTFPFTLDITSTQAREALAQTDPWEGEWLSPWR